MMYGINCYVSFHTPIKGIIKEKYEDFEVREIDLSGKIAHLSEERPVSFEESCSCMMTDEKEKDEVFSQPRNQESTIQDNQSKDTTSSSAADKKHMRSVSMGARTSTSNVERNVDLKKMEINTIDSKVPEKTSVVIDVNSKQPTELLKELLDPSVLEQLENAKLNGDAIDFVSESERLSNIDIVLGVVDDKATRTNIHQCVRYLYPHIKTKASKNNDGQTEMKACYDEVFGEFLSAGISKVDVNDLFKFIHCRLITKHETTFALKMTGNKEKRTSIHRLIRKYYGSFLESKTFSTSDEASFDINVRFRGKRTFDEIEKRSKDATTNPVYRFVLCKRNVEASDAIARLSHSLQAKPSSFCFAGTKDKKAITYQFVTTNEVDYHELDKYSRLFKGRSVEISSIERVRDNLRLGDLKGNHFKIVLRQLGVEGDDGDLKKLISLVDEAVSNVRADGFVNYFGTQRFGFEDYLINSADIGLAMMKEDFTGAIDLLLSPTGYDDVSEKAKQYFIETRDINGCIKRMPLSKTRELVVLKALKQHGYTEYGCRQALLSLPYNVRLMYVHSYCSLLWNKAATKRIKTYGLSLVEGDFVLADENPEFPIIVEKSEINGNKYDISNVVLPLPGYRINYPEHLSSFYKAMLNEDGIDEKCFRLKSLRLNVPGVYRRLISYPMNICSKIFVDGFDGCRLKITDHLTSEPADYRPSYNSLQAENHSALDIKPSNIGANLELKFSLVSSAYATVCLREIMHSSF